MCVCVCLCVCVCVCLCVCVCVCVVSACVCATLSYGHINGQLRYRSSQKVVSIYARKHRFLSTFMRMRVYIVRYFKSKYIGSNRVQMLDTSQTPYISRWKDTPFHYVSKYLHISIYTTSGKNYEIRTLKRCILSLFFYLPINKLKIDKTKNSFLS